MQIILPIIAYTENGTRLQVNPDYLACLLDNAEGVR